MFVRYATRARKPRSRSSDRNARSSHTLLTYSAASHASFFRPKRRLPISYDGSSGSNVTLLIVGSPKLKNPGAPGHPTQPTPGSWSASCVNDEPTCWNVKFAKPSIVAENGQL